MKSIKEKILINFMIVFSAVVFISLGFFIENHYLRYIFIWAGVSFLSKLLPSTRILDFFKLIIQIPIIILIVLKAITKPITLFLITIFLSFSFPIIILFGSKQLLFYAYGIHASDEASIFTFLLFTFVTTSLLGDKIVKLASTGMKSTFEILTEQKKSKAEEFVLDVFNKNNVRFLIYSIYFLVYIIYSFELENGILVFDSSKSGKAIISSFVCYIALERVLNEKKLFRLSRENLIKNYLGSIIEDLNKFKTDDKKVSD